MANNAETVFILGAGASKECGAPLMGEFLDAAHELMLQGRTNGADEDFKRVFEWVAALKRTHSMSNLDTRNIEAVFSALEMSKVLGCFSKIKGCQESEEKDEYTKTVSALKNVIAITLENKTSSPLSSQGQLSYSNYNEFASLIDDLKRRGDVRPQHSISIISFNYDLILDYTLRCREEPIRYEYCLGGACGKDAIPLLKLHGSLNWFLCEKCEKVYYDKYPQCLRYSTYGTVKSQNKCEQCDSVNEPLIVPPTWNKNDHYGKISNVWRYASEKLSKAENIFVIGFSLPETDSFFKYLYGLGTVGESHFKRFWVFNPDASVENKYRDILGPGAEKRFRYFPLTFSQDNITNAIKQIAETFGVGTSLIKRISRGSWPDRTISEVSNDW